MLHNPAVIPIILGLVLYLTGLGALSRNAFPRAEGCITAAKSLQRAYRLKEWSPLFDGRCGAKLADITFSGIFQNRYFSVFFLWPYVPLLVWGITRTLSRWTDRSAIMALLLILSPPGGGKHRHFCRALFGRRRLRGQAGCRKHAFFACFNAAYGAFALSLNAQNPKAGKESARSSKAIPKHL